MAHKQIINGTFFPDMEFPRCCGVCAMCMDYSEQHDDSKHFCGATDRLETLDEDELWVRRAPHCTARQLSISRQEPTALK